MVFPGRFSTGCMRCRQRKVKCDETKPSCRRCYIYGKPCPGYTDQFHFRHGLNNSKPAQTAALSTAPIQFHGQQTPLHEPRIQQSQPPAPAYASAQPTKTDNEHTDDSYALVAQPKRVATRYPTISPNPDLSYEHISLCYFVRRFVSPEDADSFPGHLTFLPNLFNHHGQGLLETATLSVAQMAAFNQFGGDQFRQQSYRNYGRALRELQKSIQSEQDATDDRVLTAVLLLCMFKDISGERSGDPADHAAGLYYLLEKRGMEQLATRRGFELFTMSLLRLNVYSFMHDDDTYSDPGGFTSILGVFDPLMRAMSMVSKTLGLRHALAKCTGQIQLPGDGSSPGSQDSRGSQGDSALIEECFEKLHEFGNWDTEAATYWKWTFEGRAFPTELGEAAKGARYYDPETACTVILVRCSRLILLLSMLEYRDMMQVTTNGQYGTTGGGAQWSDCVPALEQDIRSTIGDMLSCVPYALGDLDPFGQHVSMSHDGAGALVILQPMRLVTYCLYATPEQVQICQSVLARINRAIGIRSAISWKVGQRMSETAGCEFFDAISMMTPPEMSPLQDELTP